MNRVAYSHRPVLGVSVAATSQNGRLFVAVSKVNDGITLSGNFNSENRDTFSRKVARNILNGRLQNLIESGQETNMSFVLETSISAQEFMNTFRQEFKPDREENDSVFMRTISIDIFADMESHEFLVKMTAEETIEHVRVLANNALAACEEAAN